MHQIPSITRGTCSLNACLQYSLSLLHGRFSFWHAEMPETRLPAADIYIEATILIIWELNFGDMHQIPSTTGGNCSPYAWPQHNLSQMHWLLSFWPAEDPETCLPLAFIYIEATISSIWRLNFGDMHQIPTTSGGNSSPSGCLQHNLSQMHWLISFGPAEFPETYLLAACIYIEAMVSFFWNWTLAICTRYDQPLVVPAPSVHVYISVCHICTDCYHSGPPKFPKLVCQLHIHT